MLLGNTIMEIQNQIAKNQYKFCAFYLGYDDKHVNNTVILFLHFEHDDNNIYNVGVELLKDDVSSTLKWRAPNKIITNLIFNIF